MMLEVSRRGYYYNLEKSPYVVNSPYGDSFKFSSKKQMDIFNREICKALNNVDALFRLYGDKSLIPIIKKDLYREIYEKRAR